MLRLPRDAHYRWSVTETKPNARGERFMMIVDRATSVIELRPLDQYNYELATSEPVDHKYVVDSDGLRERTVFDPAPVNDAISVASATRYIVTRSGDVYSTSSETFLRPAVNVNGYNTVKLTTDDGTLRQARVHRLVASAFHANPDNESDVNHKNGKKGDNRDLNLEWMSHSGNVQHALLTGLIPIGTATPGARFNAEQIRQIRRDAATKSYREIGKEWGCDFSVISDIARGVSYRDVDPGYVPPCGLGDAARAAMARAKAKLTATDVLEIKRLRESGERAADIATHFNVNEKTIYNALSDRCTYPE